MSDITAMPTLVSRAATAPTIAGDAVVTATSQGLAVALA